VNEVPPAAGHPVLACFDDNELLELLTGSGDHSRADLDEHLDACVECRDLLSAARDLEPVADQRSREAARRR
jgi:hypothetical protein